MSTVINLGIGNIIGLVFAIIGIVQANNANSAYNVGDIMRGDSSNKSAKTMTIISYCTIALGIILLVFFIGLLGAAASDIASESYYY